MNSLRHVSGRVAIALIAVGATMISCPALAQAGAQSAKSPVDSFRELLVMPSEVRQKLLAKRSEQSRQRILEKIREYSSLLPEEREVRLQATELGWYLTPLLNGPPTNRAAQLALIPAGLRDLVQSRLQQWDLLPSPLRQALLTSHQAVSFLTRVESNAPQPSPADQVRRKLMARVKELIEQTPKEKQKTLRLLTDAEERHQMEQTLQAFAKLSPEQREKCSRSFAAFATMSEAERREFMKSAERWSQMSATEQQTWRELVSRAPSLPPIPKLRMPPRPTAPPTPTTNGG